MQDQAESQATIRAEGDAAYLADPFGQRVQVPAEDVQRIRNHPLVPRSIPIYGFMYDVRSGKLIEVEGASALGRAA